MKATRAAAAACCATVLVLAACGQSSAGSGSTAATTNPTSSAGPAPSSSSPSSTTTPDPMAMGTTITTGDSEFGTMLFDAKKQAIYLFDKETSPTAQCYGDCAAAWPPVLTEATPVAAGAVDATLLGTTKRTDGTTQVTYAGHPLYYYAHEAPGEVKCHDVRGFGGLWLVVGPDGNRRP